jgi:hypothetical protein
MSSDGINDDYKLAVGTLVIEVARLETKLTELIAFLTGLHMANALILIHHQPFLLKLDSAVAVFRLLFADEQAWETSDARAVLDRVKVVSEFRNNIVHAMWHVDAAGMPHTVRFKGRGELTRSRQPAPVENIRQYVREAAELHAKLDRLAQHHKGCARFDPQS